MFPPNAMAHGKIAGSVKQGMTSSKKEKKEVTMPTVTRSRRVWLDYFKAKNGRSKLNLAVLEERNLENFEALVSGWILLLKKLQR